MALSARFKGLLGEARVRARREGVDVFADFADRSDNLTLERSGVNAGDKCGVVELVVAAAGGAD